MRFATIAMAAVLSLLSSQVFASATFTCKNGASVRRVDNVTSDTDKEFACKVNYTKETETPGTTQTLWTAKSDPSFCETKATEFVAKLKGMGWDCTEAKE